MPNVLSKVVSSICQFCGRITSAVCSRIKGRKSNRVDPVVQEEISPQWILEQTFGFGRIPTIRDSRELINFLVPEDDDDDVVNANAANDVEAARLREVANYARGKSTHSAPFFDHSLNPPMARIKMPLKSKPLCILQQQINAFNKAAQLSKATVSNHRRQKLPVSLSDGCIPRTKDGLPEMLQLARATQLRRIIQMILLRDRNGLIEMSNRVNIAALVGMDHFDPDNLQLLELNNGLPMIAPRRREAIGNQVLGAGVAAIPQMVAAGLLPTARDLANSIEILVGQGRVRRIPPVARQLYAAPMTLVPPPAPTGPLRRVLDVDEIIANPLTHRTRSRSRSRSRSSSNSRSQAGVDQNQSPPPPQTDIEYIALSEEDEPLLA